jgi:hypothetical protein
VALRRSSPRGHAGREAGGGEDDHGVRAARASPPTLAACGRRGVGPINVLDRQTFHGVPEVVDCAVEDRDRET